MQIDQAQKKLLLELLKNTNGWEKTGDAVFKKSSDKAYGVEVKKVTISSEIHYFNVFFSTLQSYVIEKLQFNVTKCKLEALEASTIQKVVDPEIYLACEKLFNEEDKIQVEEKNSKESQLLDKFLSKF